MKYNYIYFQEKLEELNMKQREFARIANIPKTSVHKVCNGIYIPKKTSNKLPKRIVAGLKKLGVKDTHKFFINPDIYKKDDEKEEDVIMSTEILNFFKIKQDPFAAGIFDDVFLNRENQEVVELIAAAAERGKFIAIIGPVGSGKSTVFKYAISRIRDNRKLKLCRIPNIAIKRASDRTIINIILQKIGDINTLPATYDERADLMLDVIAREAEQSTIPVILIDEAHQLTDNSLKDLKILWEEFTGTDSPLSIILCAQPALYSTLVRTTMQEVYQRIEIKHIQSFHNTNHFKEKDIGDYIKFKLKTAGCQDALFTDEAIHEIARHCSTPLQVNYFCKRAMVHAFNMSETKITGDVIRLVKKD